MIQFVFNAIIVIVGIFIIVCLLCLMARVVVGLLRKLFPNKFAVISAPKERSEDSQ